jgi:hypothetical protein
MNARLEVSMMSHVENKWMLGQFVFDLAVGS